MDKLLITNLVLLVDLHVLRLCGTNFNLPVDPRALVHGAPGTSFKSYFFFILVELITAVMLLCNRTT